MKRRLVYTEDARRDLADITRALKKARGVVFAERRVGQLKRKVEDLIDFPFAFSAVPHLGEGRRRTVVWPYIVLYRVEERRVVVVGVVHGARDLKTLYGDNDDAG